MTATHSIRKVATPDDVLDSLATFNRDGPLTSTNRKRARKLLATTDRWVYHPASGSFGPCKFVGYGDMTFEVCERELKNRQEGKRTAVFDGDIARDAIQVATASQFAPRTDLWKTLKVWGNGLFPDLKQDEDPFGGFEKRKHDFVFVVVGTPAQSEAGGGTAETTSNTSRRVGTVEAAGAEAAEIAHAAGQGFRADPEVRQKVEKWAMKAAKSYFKSKGYPEVKNVSKRRPYDLRCRRGRKVLRVEVKGTQTKGEQVFLTRNEVRLARRHRGRMALFVLHSVVVTDGVASGGIPFVLDPWDVDAGVLRPVTYSYRLPERAPNSPAG